MPFDARNIDSIRPITQSEYIEYVAINVAVEHVLRRAVAKKIASQLNERLREQRREIWSTN